ncbi:MAG: hypothetical protein JWL94_1430 [Microbacteriaceae bacterium]|jgi:hypothetical protein|nr:hypothetical protein [Microbacteriaceae bacterium]
MDKSEHAPDPYEDGTVPADADLATSSEDGSAAEPSIDPVAPEPGNEPATEDEKDRAQRHY